MNLRLLLITSSFVILCGTLTSEVRPGWKPSQFGFDLGTIAIRVVVRGHPVADAKVILTQFRSSFDIRTWSKTTNKRGECTFKNLAMGTYGVHIEVPGYEPVSGSELVGRSILNEVSVYALTADQAVMGVITGKVFDKVGRGIPQADVKIIQRNTGMEYPVKSNTEGAYEKAALVPGKYLINVEASGYRRSSREVKLGARQIAKHNFNLKASSRK